MFTKDLLDQHSNSRKITPPLGEVLMRLFTLHVAVLLAGTALTVRRAFADGDGMVRLAGTPDQIGTIWGEINKEALARDIEASYLKRATTAGISRERLLKRSAASVRIIEHIAPHWLEEARAVARAASVPEDLYIAYLDGAVRSRFLGEDPEECTSYAVSREHARGGAIMFHKTRDNRDVPQAVYIVESSLEGINKFIAVSNATGLLGLSMMVNEKGLAGAGDYPADRKKDSSALRLEPARNRFRGVMSGTILRHIAERASNCAEALAIIEHCVDKGRYAGGKVGGSHWLFVDCEGTILEVCNNPGHVVSKVHTQKAYFSRLNKSAAARRLRESTEPVDFSLFHGVSRDPSICLGSSISGMTVEIDPDDPERFTCAWVALPARAAAFPLLMGQSQTPRCLVDGAAYELGKKCPRQTSRWQAMEQSIHSESERLKEEWKASIDAGNPERAQVEMMEQWSQTQANDLMAALRE
jgi:hypothetical protein